MLKKSSLRKPAGKLKDKNNIMIIAIVSIVMLGILAGSYLANSLDSDNQVRLASYLDKFFENYRLLLPEGSDIFKESFVKYGKIVLIIWLFAFMPFGVVLGGLVVLFKGVSYGFTTAFLIMSYGPEGVYFACLLYLLQNIILIPAYIFVSYAGIKFVYGKNGRMPNDTIDGFFEYGMSLVISLSCVILAGFLEAYVIPNLIFNI
ncbi:MAG: stage II sporulation protein M [Clostridiales bacterium]|nr:stage II sporulation protein M [Clostridiales bacterium]